MSTKIAFFKSYYKLGWWAARVPRTEDWSGHAVEVLGFGVTTNQAERDLLRKECEREFAAGEVLAA
jgi:hypothetical protein